MAVQFGDFTLDESRRQLLRGAEAIHLSPKAFQLLSILLAESPRAVSKKDLHERLWPDTFVTEGNLAGTVAELRSVLGDDRRKPRFIRTLYGFGYSFAATAPEETSPAPLHAHSRTIAVLGLLAVAGIIAMLSWRQLTGSKVAAPAPIQTLAILPFDTSGTEGADRHLGLGLPDLLITRLGNVRELVVRPTSSVRDFAVNHVDWREAGRKLKVDAVLEGSVRTTADRVRVTVRLMKVEDQRTIWAEAFDAKRSDVFSIEDNISARVAEALTTRLSPSERMLLRKHYTADPQAYDLYVQGRYEFERAREGEAADRARSIELFRKALQKDPAYALAWAGLAQANASMGIHHQASPQVVFPEAQNAASKALDLDQDLSEAHCAAGSVRMYWNLDFEGAEREFRRALELNPRNAIALDYYGFLLQCLQRSDESIALRERLLELNPLSVAANWSLANAYLSAGQNIRGIQQTMLVLAMNPRYAPANDALTRFYAMHGDYDKAIASAQKNVQMNPDPRSLAFLGYALGRAGRRADAGAILQRLDADPKSLPFYAAFVHVGLGDRDAVFPLLEKGLTDRTYVLRLKTEPIFEPLRSDPRFQSLLRRAGFGS